MEDKGRTYKLNVRSKLILFFCLIILNIILHIQPSMREIGTDSFEIHAMINSISEFGYAKWVISFSSFFGLTPASYTSAVQFLLSGIHQLTGIEISWIIFLYGIFLGSLSIFFAYLFAGEILNNDIFKFLASFGFSTSSALLDFSTWTLTTRGLVLIFAPLFLFVLLRINTENKIKKEYIILIILVSILIFTSHHLSYFLIPSYFTIIILTALYRLNFFQKVNSKVTILVTYCLFLLMLSIPIVFKKFIESSRYYPFYIDLFRYNGPFFLFAVGGFVFLSLKPNKSFREWFLLVNTIFLTAFVYNQTYFKHFSAGFIIFLACIGIFNIMKTQKKATHFIIITLIISISFSGYYQFLNQYPENRHISDSAYNSGKWLKYYGNGSGISNDLLLGIRIGSISESVHFITNSMVMNNAYGFLNLNYSEFTYYPITSENFWFNTGKFKKDYGEIAWYNFNMLDFRMLEINTTESNVKYILENTNTNGYIIWNHGPKKSEMLEKTYNNLGSVYHTNNMRIYFNSGELF